MRFYSVDTLTGRIIGGLYPESWELSSPLRSPGVGSLNVAKPDESGRGPLRELLGVSGDGSTFHASRWVAAQDDTTGKWLWGGPITKKPALNGDTIAVEVADWRTWFYQAQLRPTAAGKWHDYIVTQRDQMLIADDLFKLALSTEYWPGDDSTLAPPPIHVDTPAESGVKRDLTARMLDRPLAEVIDTDLVNVDEGIEWWTYITPSLSDPQVLEVHVSTAWPERSSRDTSILVSWQEGRGGNAAEASWPPGGAPVSRMWAIGDAEAPSTAWAVDEDTDARVLWEGKVGPLTGVKKAKTAYEHALAERELSDGRDSAAEFVIVEDELGLSMVEVGDRARVIYDDGWESVDVDQARIVERILSGGAGDATQQRLILDLADVVPADDGTEPGVDGEAEE